MVNEVLYLLLVLLSITTSGDNFDLFVRSLYVRTNEGAGHGRPI